MAAIKDRLDPLEQLTRDDGLVAMRIETVLLGASHAVVERVFENEFYVTARQDLAFTVTQPKSGYFTVHGRDRVVAGRIKQEEALNEVGTFMIENDVFSQAFLYIMRDIEISNSHVTGPLADTTLLFKRSLYVVADGIRVVLREA